ncbi:VOC family protein [Saccharibacillus sacchari]|uniref:VOC family protein n=1 Tax=Saccharibacillus sacchari TaxID=456493 RepID=A0ACC6PF86_9BACL
MNKKHPKELSDSMEAESIVVRGVDHIGITVSDMDQATTFFQKAFGAIVCYNGLTADQEPQQGKQTEQRLGLKPGAKVVQIRMLRIGNSVNLELFRFEDTEQSEPAIASDLGVQHFGFYTDNLDEAVRRFEDAGGTLLSEPSELTGWESGTGDSSEPNRFVYGRTPWGMLIELLSLPKGVRYPDETEAKRWEPND